MPKNLLDLDGKELQRELDRIVEANPPRSRPWTRKEVEILQKLRAKRVPTRKIAEILGRSISSVFNRVEKS